MATHLDLGIGAPSIGVKGRGESGGGMSGGDWQNVLGSVGHMAEAVAPFAAMAIGAGKPKRTRKKTGTGVSGGTKLGYLNLPLGDESTQAPHAVIAPQASPEKDQFGPVSKSDMPAIKGGKQRTVSAAMSHRAELVKKAMKEKGLSMIEASKYVKAHNLHKK